MQKTEYLKLNKPDSTDFFSVDHQNQNMELIDEEFAKKADKKEIENIKSDLTELDNSKLKGYTVSYTVPANTGGWHKIAQITGVHFNFDLYTTGNWNNQRKSNAHFQIQNINGIVRIVQLSGISDPGGIRTIRMVRVVDDRDTWILEENSTPTSRAETFKFTIAGDVIVTPLDGSVDTTTDFKDSVSLEVSNVPTGTVITTSNVDSALSSTSTNPVQNKVVKAEFDKLDSNLSDLGKCKNLLKSILQTTTLNGVTCIYNGDGTYTLNGTATVKTFFNFILNYNLKKDTKIIGCPPNGSANSFGIFIYNVAGGFDYGNGFIFKEDHTTRAGIYINSGYTCNNLVFKPMLTTNLNATYDDFVPYTGDGDTLTADVAKINENLKNGAVTGIKGNAETKYRTGNVNITAKDIGMNVDSALSSTSTNPVQNKVVAAALDGKMPVYSYNGGTFDADDLTSPAIHFISSGGTNLPASCSGGVLLVDGSPQTTQYFFPLYNGDNRIHTRYKYHGTEWMDWEILGLSTSQSTAITTAGKYALDAVQNNASVSGTLANRIKAVEDTVGKVYSKTETVYGSGAWKMSGGLTVPAGTYIITRKGTNINGAGVSLGCGYNALSFVTTPADASTGIYTDIVTYTDSSNSIYIYYCAALNSTINLEIKAVRIK